MGVRALCLQSELWARHGVGRKLPYMLLSGVEHWGGDNCSLYLGDKEWDEDVDNYGNDNEQSRSLPEPRTILLLTPLGLWDKVYQASQGRH